MEEEQPRLLKMLTLDELIDAYERACKWYKLLTNPDSNVRFALGQKDLEHHLQVVAIDKNHIWLALQTKIPPSHIFEIETLKNEMALGTKDSEKIPVSTGQRWEHKFKENMIIEVVRADGRLWVCSQYLDDKYIMVAHLSTHVITTNYKEIL